MSNNKLHEIKILFCADSRLRSENTISDNNIKMISKYSKYIDLTECCLHWFNNFDWLAFCISLMIPNSTFFFLWIPLFLNTLQTEVSQFLFILSTYTNR